MNPSIRQLNGYLTRNSIKASKKKLIGLCLITFLLISPLIFLLPRVTHVSAEDDAKKHKRVKLAKHIVNGSGVSAEKFEEWIAEANKKWNCSIILEDGSPDTVNETDIGKTKTKGAIDVYGVSQARGEAGNYYGACWDQQRIEVCNDSKIDTLAHEIGHWFGLNDVSDPNDLMYSGCSRVGNATVPAVNQTLVRENVTMWLNKGAALNSNQAQEVIDSVGDVTPDPGLSYLDLYHVDSFFDVFVEVPTLRLSLSIVNLAYMPFDGELGFLIEADNDPLTGQGPEGFDYAVYLNPLTEELHFDKYEAGWTPIDPSGISFDYTYYYPDYRDPDPTLPIREIIGVSMTVPGYKLTGGYGGGHGGIPLSIRAVAADIFGIDYAPDAPGLMELTMYFKPVYEDYAQSGVPDFDQRQDAWTDPFTGQWSWCGPISVANSLWWMDSRFEPNPIPPPTINDGYQLLTAYGPWDDHDPRNLDPFARDLAWWMDTDGQRTGIIHSGTFVHDMEWGIDQYLIQQGLYGILYERTLQMPTFAEVAQEVEKCEDVILLLGFWQDQGGPWIRVGGHYVTVAGVDVTKGQIAISDPIRNNAEPPPEGNSGPGRVLPQPHGPPYPHSTDLHNDSIYVSHDIYTFGSSPSPGNPEFGLPDYPTEDLYFENFLGQNFDPGEFGPYLPGIPVFTEVEYAVVISPYDWFFKGWPGGYEDYAPHGIPDFDQRQNGTGAYAPWNWTNPYPPVGQPSFCGPTAIANSLWWLDSQFEPNPVPPPTINDNFPLVESYNPGVWDDHDPQNVPYLIEDLALLMDTNGIQSGDQHCGTEVHVMEDGIEEYLRIKGLDWKFYEHTVKMPTYELIVEEVKKSQDVTLLLGFWQQDPASGIWFRTGGHYVTVAGVDPSRMKIAFSDPIDNAAEWPPGIVPGATGEGHVAPPPNPHLGNPSHSTMLHNNASYVSHDIYTVNPTSPSPGGLIGLDDYWFADEYGHVWGSCQNTPEEYIGVDQDYNPALPVFVEIEYAVIVSCRTGIVAAGSADETLRVWDFYGNLTWQQNLGKDVVSVAMDNNAKFVAAGTRLMPTIRPSFGDLWLFDANGIFQWMQPNINVSTSFNGGWAGQESKSVDVKYNVYNGSVVVAAATDWGLHLYDEWGNLIFHFVDVLAPSQTMTIARISQDGNYIIAGDYVDGLIYYFSHLTDGTPGWGPGDGWPVWVRGADAGYYWVAISGLGDYVAASRRFSPTAAYVDFYNKTGAIVWSSNVSHAFVRVDMPCHGKSVVAANDDPDQTQGAELYYWDDGGNGWDSSDSAVIWTYWPGKEGGSPKNLQADFYTVAISENGDYIATGGAPPNTYLLTNTGTIQQIIPSTPGNATQSVDLTFSGKYGASGDNWGVLWFFEKDLGLQWSWPNGGARIYSVAISKIYPCMFPFPDHDLAITNVTPNSTSVTIGDTVDVNITIANEGNHVESFFDVYLEPLLNGMPQPTVTPLPTTITSLSNGSSTEITFAWDTTGLVAENYTLVAKTSIVYNEIDVFDNTYVDSVVEVKVSVGVHDIAVTNLTSCYGSTILTQNFTYIVNITVTNEGDFAEIFTLTLYWNNTNTINSTTVIIALGGTKVVQLDWNTTGLQRYANYTLRTHATPVPGETDTADNTFDDPRTLIMVYTGDINNDKKVDIKDIAAIAKLFGVNHPNPLYDPDKDITCDGKIDIKDVALAAKEFGYVEP